MSETPLIELKNITKRYGVGAAAFDALKGVSFAVHQGEFLAVMGPSGSGKSTTMNIIGALDSPTSGEYLFEGVHVEMLTKDERALLRRLCMGFVFQGFNLLARTTALENVELPLLYRGVPAKERHEAARKALDRVGLLEWEHHTPAELSGGQQQRAAIARALAPNPGLLLLDEPTSALDPEYTSEVLDVVDELRAEGVEFIIVTHEMGFARRACETTAFLYQGKILEAGLSAELFERPKTAELKKFLGRILEWNA